MIDTTPFEQLRRAAEAQLQPQRLLFVFAGSELPEDADAAQRAAFAAGRGGALAPLMCVDKAPEELQGFAALRAEAAQAGPPWQVLFAAGLSGRRGAPPDATQIDAGLRQLVERVRQGRIEGLLALDRDGNSLSFD